MYVKAQIIVKNSCCVCDGLMVTDYLISNLVSTGNNQFDTVLTQTRPPWPEVYSRANKIVSAPKFGLPHSQQLLRITKVKWTIVSAISEKHASVTISHKQQGPYSCRIIILMEHIKRALCSFEVLLPGGRAVWKEANSKLNIRDASMLAVHSE